MDACLPLCLRLGKWNERRVARAVLYIHALAKNFDSASTEQVRRCNCSDEHGIASSQHHSKEYSRKLKGLSAESDGRLAAADGPATAETPVFPPPSDLLSTPYGFTCFAGISQRAAAAGHVPYCGSIVIPSSQCEREREEGKGEVLDVH